MAKLSQAKQDIYIFLNQIFLPISPIDSEKKAITLKNSVAILRTCKLTEATERAAFEDPGTSQSFSASNKSRTHLLQLGALWVWRPHIEGEREKRWLGSCWFYYDFVGLFVRQR